MRSSRTRDIVHATDYRPHYPQAKRATHDYLFWFSRFAHHSRASGFDLRGGRVLAATPCVVAWSGGIGNNRPSGLAFQVPFVDGFDLPASFLDQEPLIFVLIQGSAQQVLPRTNYFPNTLRTNLSEFLTLVNHHAACFIEIVSARMRAVGEILRGAGPTVDRCRMPALNHIRAYTTAVPNFRHGR